MIEPTKDGRGKIINAVRRVCADAGLDYETLALGIVPLSEIIGAYPLRVAELPDDHLRLTYHAALKFLGRETRHELPSPDGNDRPLSGFLYAYDYENCFYGCILTERSDPTPRRRYSAAHELGHYLLHFLPLLEKKRRGDVLESLVLVEGLSFNDEKETDKETLSAELDLTAAIGLDTSWRQPLVNTEEMEREADMFAAELLMPAHACHALAERYVKKFGRNKAVVARLLATEFLVSQAAMKRRLTDLGLYRESGEM